MGGYFFLYKAPIAKPMPKPKAIQPTPRPRTPSMVSVVNMGITPHVQEISGKPDFYVIGGSQSLR